ncbi:MATH domain and coiled-coil domain-containing protein At3g58400-like [Rhododendron vialii]|uniref:MATH domain and coiled-coil domain-containing protein At3g58400-like n=1 Tax=Rhododendron vialii TaxID=182163 RepID=UPI00265E2568|nr:MATH domain and coiled-coil domain-containing protein At3g58400-like [Rhododendron vialii]
MEDPLPNDNADSEVVRSTREVPPAHYTIKVDSFSLLSNILSASEVEKYESDMFEAGGYKWKLLLYPRGRTERNANGYVSLYLEIAETDTLPLGWEMNVKFSIFVYDQLRDKYLTFQDGHGGMVRFHGMKTEHGFARLLSLENFSNASNGYLVDDSCIFGAEIFVIKSTGNGECVSVVKTGDDNFHSWKLEKFSALNTKRCWSEEFTSAGQKWKLAVYPKGYSSQSGEYLCLAIILADSVSLPPGRLLYAEYRLCIRDQIRGQHEEITDASWFSTSSKCLYMEFLSLSALHDPSRGFLVNDTLIVEGQIKFSTAVKRFS